MNPRCETMMRYGMPCADGPCRGREWYSGPFKWWSLLQWLWKPWRGRLTISRFWARGKWPFGFGIRFYNKVCANHAFIAKTNLCPVRIENIDEVRACSCCKDVPIVGYLWVDPHVYYGHIKLSQTLAIDEKMRRIKVRRMVGEEE